MCVALCSCGTINLRPTMESDPAETGVEGVAYINQLWDAYEPHDNKYCKKTVPSYQKRDNESYKRYYGDKPVIGEAFDCVRFKEKPDKDARRYYLDAGFALSDFYCKKFFRRITAHTQERGFARNEVNDVGSLMSTILGLASVGSGYVGGIGAGFGLADGAFRSYDQQFVVSPDLANVQSLVIAAQQQFAKQAYEAQANDKGSDNYPALSMIIQDHANYCSFLGMRTLINASVSRNAQVTAVTGISPNSTSPVSPADFAAAAIKQAEAEAAPAQPAAPAVPIPK